MRFALVALGIMVLALTGCQRGGGSYYGGSSVQHIVVHHTVQHTVVHHVVHHVVVHHVVHHSGRHR